MGLILLVLVLLLLFGGLPAWHWHSYGYYPSSLGAILLIVLLLAFLTGRL